MNLRTDPGFMGTDALLISDLTLIAYIFILVPLMLVGFSYARRKMFEPHHKMVMTTITLLNWVLILFVMAVSYTDVVLPNVPDRMNERFYLLPTLHLITGATAQLLATYLVARMWLPLPGWLKIKRIKTPMRITLTLWITTALLGIILYLTWYNAPASAGDGDSLSPIVTEEPAPGVGDEATAEVTSEMVPPEATEEALVPLVTEEADDSDDDSGSDDSSDDDDNAGSGSDDSDDDSQGEAAEVSPPLATEESTPLPSRTPRPTFAPGAAATDAPADPAATEEAGA
ncbi:MAG: hypothetical protein OHK0046_19160 [Anaerolineae bacterium]